MYKSTFKDLKRKCPPPDYSKVVDFDKYEQSGVKVVKLNDLQEGNPSDKEVFLLKHVKPVKDWKVYELEGKPGLLFIKNPFTWIGQRYWICRCLQDFSQKPNRLNLDAHNELKPGEDWWKCSIGKDNKSAALRKKLRWATLGYHHDWNTKVYSEAARDPFPIDLADLSRFVAKAIGFPEPFEAQAAIVNYYHFDSTLSGHTDHSEEHCTAPLLSFSFGQTAIFLLGGQIIEDIPTAMYIRSGDIVIMSGYSRLCYHGIPKILKSTSTPWEPDFGAILEITNSPLNQTQAFIHEDSPVEKKTEPVADKCGNSSVEAKNKVSPISKKRKREADSNLLCENIDCSKCEHLSDEKLWLPFKKYVESSRINMNVRQVLFAGQKALKSHDYSEDIDKS